MFLLNRGYSTKIDKELSIQGLILSAAGVNMPALKRRQLSSDLQIKLFDPQMYFPIDLNSTCKTTFNKLSTYPWYNPNCPTFDSQEINLRDFSKQLQKKNSHSTVSYPNSSMDLKGRIKNCIDFQLSIDTSHIILPTPLVVDSEDQYTCQLTWINTALELCSNFNKPKLITVALSDSVLINKSFESNSLIQTILDNLTAFDNVDGFYIVISRSSSNTNITEKNIVQTVLEFSYVLGHLMGKQVFFNFIDNLGFLALAAGASYFASGYTNKERRLNFDDFIDSSSGGAPLPHFYSYTLIGDLFTDRDLSKIRDARLLNFIKDDITNFSENLYNALKSNIDIENLPDWRESRNNVTKAKLHRAELLHTKVGELMSLDFNTKINYTLSWLQQAEINASYLENRFKNDPISEDFRHITVWRNCFEKFIEKYNLL